MKLEKGFITVIGSSRARSDELEEASRVGAILAAEGWGLISGGRGGVMEAVAKAHSAGGGLSIGILPDADLRSANAFNTINLPTGIGFSRNLPNVLAGKGVVVVGGSVGTLTEVGYAIQFRRPVFLLSYISGVSSISREFLLEIAPYARLAFAEEPGDLQRSLREWLMDLSLDQG